MSERRDFLFQCCALVAAAVLPEHRPDPVADAMCHPSASSAMTHAALQVIQHPTPRKGITAAKVLTAEQLSSRPDLVPLFDGIRAMPAIADGIRCHCGCAELAGYYSLLSCYEGDAMAKICPICQGQGKLTVRLHGEGKTLAEIRVAVDAQFG